MRVVVQRAAHGSCTVDGKVTGSIAQGLVILLGVMQGDTLAQARKLAARCVKLRCFSDENDKMNLSVTDVGGGALVVSNFTLAANYAKGNRPDYLRAAAPAVAEPLYVRFSEFLRERVGRVENGVFGADMKVELLNDGPVTIIMDTDEWLK